MKYINLLGLLLASIPIAALSQLNPLDNESNQPSTQTLNEENAIEDLRTKNVRQVMFLNGRHADEENGYLAYASLNPEFDYDKFTMALNFLPYANEDNNYTIVVGGIATRWISLHVNEGILQLSLNNHKKTYPLPNLTIKNNQWNHATISTDIAKKEILITLNGWSLEVINLDHDFQFDPKRNNIPDKYISFSDFSCGCVFHGFVSDIKVFKKPLKYTEMWLLFMADAIDPISSDGEAINQ
ncbi:hypothetical protein [Zooshikella sp. RANM57]|uniref:hypothetical protein n=1 Tax=Zooshikella sp. RANM57 TaxID=3425863 RepID=UPI003D701258